MWSKAVGLLMMAGVGLCAALAHLSAPWFEAKGDFRQEEIEAAQESIALSLMGQLQLTAGSLLWLKTLEYLHNGVAYRAPTKTEEEAGATMHESVDTPGGLAHKDGLPMVPDKNRDWRGFAGDLQREIMPYQEHITHSDPKELIPWYRLAIRLNPNLERLYTLGAFFLADFAHEPDEAMRTLEAGVEANPWSFEIHASLGRLYFDYHQALGIEPREAYERTAALLTKAIDLGDKEKAALEKRGEQLDPLQQQLLGESYLFLARSYTELGRYEDALRVCDDGLRKTSYSLLRVQRRATEKAQRGEGTGESSRASPANTQQQDTQPCEVYEQPRALSHC
jgi:tetratricopeptide (TPR) repeat protein